MTYTRRALAFLFPAFACAQQPAPAPARLPSGVFPFERLQGRKSGTINLYQILTGTTHTGYKLDLHESDLPPGAVPHPPHQHVHEELLFVREGEMEVLLDGNWTAMGPGSCAYMASNDLHGYRNSSKNVVRYFVLALGTD